MLRARITGVPEGWNPRISSRTGSGSSCPASATRRQASTPETDSFTDCTIYSSRRLRGFRRPGVSKKTSWVSFSVKIPVMRVRVVCGFWETMAIFLPIMVFSREDFPTLGAPTIATKADLRLSFTALLPFFFLSYELCPEYRGDLTQRSKSWQL